MSARGKRVIYVGFAGGKRSKPLCIESVAIGLISPGGVLFEASDGLSRNTVLATTFGEQLIIADIDRVGNNTVDDRWTNGENIVAILPRSGEFINILVGPNNVLIKGSPLSRAGNGVLKLAVTDSSEEIAGYSDEIIITPVMVNTLVRVRVV